MDAIIADNVCRNVDHQCLIATAEEAGEQGDIGRSHGIEFTGNVCEVEGSQAVLVRWFPDVVVQGNSFDGPGWPAPRSSSKGRRAGSSPATPFPPGVRRTRWTASSRRRLRAG